MSQHLTIAAQWTIEAEDRWLVLAVLDQSDVCHVAVDCFSVVMKRGGPKAGVWAEAACGADMVGKQWCEGANCVECDTCREACGRCGRLVCEKCREAIAEVP